jgi:hypothetical protein
VPKCPRPADGHTKGQINLIISAEIRLRLIDFFFTLSGMWGLGERAHLMKEVASGVWDLVQRGAHHLVESGV